MADNPTYTTFSQFTPVDVFPGWRDNGSANKVLMSTGGGTTWTVVPIEAGGTGKTTAQEALDALTIGNLNLTGQGARIRSDYSNNNLTLRTYFVTSYTNSGTNVGVAPNGTVAAGTVASSIQLEDNKSMSTGTGSVLQAEMVQGTEARIRSGARGAGTVLPLAMYVGSKHTTLEFKGVSSSVAATTISGTTGSELVLGIPSGSTVLRTGEVAGSAYAQITASDAGMPAYYDFNTHTFRDVTGKLQLTIGNFGQVGVGNTGAFGTDGQLLMSGGDSKAPRWSSSLVGSTTAVTQPAGTNNTTIATTAFVVNTAMPKSSQFSVGDQGQLKLGTGANAGVAGQILTSGGPGAAAVWSSSLADGTTAVTQPFGTKDTTVATTEFVHNGFVQKSQLKDIPNDLLVTATGSLDFQFSIMNTYSGSVTSAGTPSYISNFNNPAYNPMLTGGTVNNIITPGYGSANILGTAANLGDNYTVINSQYGTLLSGGTVNTSVANAPFAYKVSGTITMVIDVAQAAGLSDTKFISGTTTINPAWKGNYKFSAFSALFKIRELNFWDYTGKQDTFEYSVNMTPITSDYEDVNHGKYFVSATVYASASYHAANLGARWLGIATKLRNI